MTLNYATQNKLTLIGSKTTLGVTTGVTLTDYYDFDGTTTKAFTTGEASRIEFIGKWTTGSGETSNTLQIIVDASTDNINWYRLLNEAVSTGTSTLTQREFTITQVTDYGTLAYDSQSANFTVGLLASGSGTGTGYIEADEDDGTTGTLTLSNIDSTFVNDETLTDSSTGSATVKGILTSITNFSLPLDIQNKYLRISVKESGVASNAGNIYMEAVVSGR